jgi:uncharacterized membrane protein
MVEVHLAGSIQSASQRSKFRVAASYQKQLPLACPGVASVWLDHWSDDSATCYIGGRRVEHWLRDGVCAK